MSNNDPLSKVSLNALWYWRGDGIPALVAGLAYSLLVGSAVTLVIAALYSSPDWQWLTGSLFVLWLPGAVIFSNWLVNNYEETIERLKVRITYPRTGYVAPPSYWRQDEEKAPQRIDAWMERYPIRKRIFHGTMFLSYLFFVLFRNARFLPDWMEHFGKSVLPWACIAVVILFIPSLLLHYARKLSTSRLYWIPILSILAYLVVLVWLSRKYPAWDFLLLLWLPVLLEDYVSKLLANKVHWTELAAILPYLVLLVWLMKKDAGWGFVLLLLTPGIYLILKGDVLFIRYLYLHRTPQAS